MEKKKCSKCGVEKNVCEFYKTNGDKYRSKCKICYKELTSAYSKNNRKKRNEIQKEWRLNNQNKVKEYRKKYYNENPEKFIKISSNYRRKNPEKIKKQLREYYYKNKEKSNERSKLWREKNQEIKKEYQKNWKNINRQNIRNYIKNRYDNDILFKLITNSRNRIVQFLKTKNVNKSSKTFEILGCTPKELKEHLEKHFTEGMTWENHNYNGWHIDHIIPLSSATTKEEIIKLCHYTNLQPLWAEENMKKSNKLIN